ncbi:MAG TPA: ribosome small subunit-dependent GTPase A [Candidatus Eisenbergiella intestinipullorum]|nr:ribosome small subunit-dependent GTPase A [Candidatus Eisenbergiella intestinipullorum]
MRGRIIRGIAGFYYVAPAPGGAEGNGGTSGITSLKEQDREVLYECRAKGIFRRDGKKPLPGDYVEFDIINEEEKEGNVRQLLPRSSQLIRPAVANVDQALIIMAAVSPRPNLNLMDRFLVTMEQQGIACCICFNKKDLADEETCRTLAESYRSTGYPVVFTSAATQEGLSGLRRLLEGRTTTVAGPSGVGKSSLINTLQDGVSMQTGEISRIERGRHTTRHSELIRIRPGTWIVDTPGFSSIELFGMEKEELDRYFPEFVKWEPQCRFTGCAHISEPGCGVKAALERGEISESRYENYCQLYAELKDRKKY